MGTLARKLLDNVLTNVISITYVGGTNITSGATNYTFTNHAIGAANSKRRVVVIAYPNGGSNSPTISSITIGGNTADIDVSLVTTIANGPMAIASLDVPTGTTATIVVNCSASSSRCRIEVYSIVGDISTPVLKHTGQIRAAATTSRTRTVNASNGNAVIAGCGVEGTDTPNLAWTNVTEDSENYTGSSVRDMSVASEEITSGTTRAVTCSSGVTTVDMGLLVASYE